VNWISRSNARTLVAPRRTLARHPS